MGVSKMLSDTPIRGVNEHFSDKADIHIFVVSGYLFDTTLPFASSRYQL